MTDLLTRLSGVFDDIGLDALWLTTLLVGLPLLVLVLGEVVVRARRSGVPYVRSIKLLRNVVIPLAAVFVLVTQIADQPADSFELKLLITLTVIIALIAVLGVINGVLFTGGKAAVANVPKLFLDLGRVIVVAIGIAIVMSEVWNADLGELVTALGVSSIVIGLALQDTLGNLFSGITLLYEQPFREGDYIKVGDVAGKVVEVNWRAVRLLTREKDLIVLPHYMVAQSAIYNRSQPIRPWAQKLIIGFSYDDAPNHVKDVMYAVLDETPGVLAEPAPEVKTENYGDSSVDYEVEYFIEDYRVNEEVKDAFMTRVWYAAKREGLTIPFPIRTLYHQEPATSQEEADTLRARLDRAARMLAPRAKHPPRISEHGARYEHFGIGEEVIPYGKRADGLYLVLDGEADMYTIDAAGERVRVGHLAPGDFFTEMVLPGMRQGATEVVAATDLESVHLSGDQLRRLVNRDQALARRLDEVNAARRQQIRALRGGRTEIAGRRYTGINPDIDRRAGDLPQPRAATPAVPLFPNGNDSK